MSKTVAETLLDMLVHAGAKRVYGLVGDSLNGISDAIRREKILQWVPVRHEESAAFAAGAEAHLTGQLAVCAGSCGPGNLHLINGLFDCHRSRVPVLAIAAQIPSGELGTGYFQETHPEVLFKECSYYCELISQPDQLPRVLGIALRTSLVKRGVSVIVLPGDIATRACPAPAAPLAILDSNSVTRPSTAELQRAADLLNKSSKVTILAGAGCKGSHTQLLTVAEQLKAPIVHALRGKEFVEHDNPYDVGMSGLIGQSSGYYALTKCDALLMLGTDFPYVQFFPKDAKVVQVDLRGENIGKRTNVEIGLVGDVRETLQGLSPLLDHKTERKHLDTSLENYQDAQKDLHELATGEPGRTPIHPQYVAKVIDDVAADDAIFTCDVGCPTIWAARYLHMNGKRRLVGSFNHGSMASALPQALGAQVSHPDRQVIALSGDGGLAMLLGDLLSLRQLNIPVKIVVFNNSSLGFVALEMKAAGMLDYGTDLVNPNFAKLAEAANIFGLRVEKPEDLESALLRTLEHPGPALLDVVVNKQEISLPPTITADQAFGFSLYMMKALMNGRADQVVDLAKSNLLR